MSLQQLVLQGGISGHVLLGGDFNAKVAVGVGTSSSEVTHCQGLNAHGTHMLTLCEAGNVSLCTGNVKGDIAAPPTYHATVRSGPTRPDHVLVSPPLLALGLSLEVQSQPLGSDHYPMHVTLAIPTSSRGNGSEIGTPLHPIRWTDAVRRGSARFHWPSVAKVKPSIAWTIMSLELELT